MPPGKPARWTAWPSRLLSTLAVLGVLWALAEDWAPLGPERGMIRNLVFLATMIGSVLAVLLLFVRLLLGL